MAPLALQWTGPGIDAGDTWFTGALSQFGCVVQNQGATAESARITLTGIVDGVYGIVPCIQVRNDGEDGAGTVVSFRFDGELDLVQPWQLSIPVDTPLIATRYGGKLHGTFNLGEAVSASDGGFVRQTNLSDGPFAPPLLMLAAEIIADGTPTIAVALDDSGGGALTITDPITLSVEGVPTTALPVDTGGPGFTFTFGGNANPGDRIRAGAWQSGVRGSNGSWLAPFSVLAGS